MSESKHTHTPGPWSSDRPWSGFGAIRDSRDRIVFALAHGSSSESYTPADECEANARLISAAPDLLESLIEMTAVCAAAMRAIARTPNAMDAFEGEFEQLGINKGFGVRANAAIAKAKGGAS